MVAMISISQASSQKSQGMDKRLISSAMSAAHPNIGNDATVVAMGTDSQMRTLIEGTNDFTCMPDNPATPGPDPMYKDRNALECAMARVSKTEPPKGRVGFLYMLAGGIDASNTDPYATKSTRK